MDVVQNYVLNSVAASGADATIAGSILTMKVNDAGLIRNFDLTVLKRGSLVKTTTVAEVLQVSTVTYTFALNSAFSFTVSQEIDGVKKTAVITVNTTAPGITTDALVASYIAKLVNAQGFKITVSGSASPVTLTAQAGYPKFDIKAVANTAIATTTAGVNAVNTYASMTAQGITGQTSGSTYTSYKFINGNRKPGLFGREAIIEEEEVNIYLNGGDGDTAGLVTQLDNWFGGLNTAGSAANQEAYSIT